MSIDPNHPHAEDMTSESLVVRLRILDKQVLQELQESTGYDRAALTRMALWDLYQKLGYMFRKRPQKRKESE